MATQSKPNHPLRVLLAGGGTAGHVNPLIAVAEELRSRGHEVAALGTSEGLESRLLPLANIPFYTVPKVPLPRRPNLDLLRLPNHLRAARRAASEACLDFRADAVVGFGGYVSTPAYLAARKLKLPVVIHEQNARPGVANRLGARWAKAVAVTFPQTNLTASKVISTVTGLPLRPEILELATKLGDEESRLAIRREAAEFFGLEANRPTLLLTGGSLGALHLNRVMSHAAKNLDASIQVIHLTGRGKDTEVKEVVGDRPGYVILDYLDRMHLALALADFVICRSGAGTVSELTALGLPACYVPLPIGNGEQRLNATEVVSAKGAFLCLDKAFDEAEIDRVAKVMLDGQALSEMAIRSAECGRLDAHQLVADLVEKVAD